MMEDKDKKIPEVDTEFSAADDEKLRASLEEEERLRAASVQEEMREMEEESRNAPEVHDYREVVDDEPAGPSAPRNTRNTSQSDAFGDIDIPRADSVPAGGDYRGQREEGTGGRDYSSGQDEQRRQNSAGRAGNMDGSRRGEQYGRNSRGEDAVSSRGDRNAAARKEREEAERELERAKKARRKAEKEYRKAEQLDRRRERLEDESDGPDEEEDYPDAEERSGRRRRGDEWADDDENTTRLSDTARIARTGGKRRRKSEAEEEEHYKKVYYGDDYEEYERNGKRRKKKKAGPFRKFLRVLLIILLILILLAAFVYYRIHGGSGDFIKKVNEAISENVTNDTSMDGYTNIALFGVDSITQSLSSGNNRSDVNIILSINDKTKECKLVSVYRDTYLDIGDATYTKCNAAYAYGGPSQAVAMLNQNFDLNIQDYATIGFGGVTDIIDAVGGVEIDVQENEISFLNDYQSTMAQELGKEYIPVTAAGKQTLNGLQATAYCRIRYTDGGDFQRTVRQRTVLTQTFEKLKAASPATVVSTASTLIANNEVQTSLSIAELTELASNSGSYSVTDTAGVPQENLRTDAIVNEQDCIIPVTLADNVVWLHNYLFGEENYQVSDTVQTISGQIRANTGY